jgi:hypothetical protein
MKLNITYPSGRTETLSTKTKKDLEGKLTKLRAIYGDGIVITNENGRRM